MTVGLKEECNGQKHMSVPFRDRSKVHQLKWHLLSENLKYYSRSNHSFEVLKVWLDARIHLIT